MRLDSLFGVVLVHAFHVDALSGSADIGHQALAVLRRPLRPFADGGPWLVRIADGIAVVVPGVDRGRVLFVERDAHTGQRGHYRGALALVEVGEIRVPQDLVQFLQREGRTAFRPVFPGRPFQDLGERTAPVLVRTRMVGVGPP